MLNALTYATVAEVFMMDENTVRFRIDLASHVHLTNPALVQHAMDEYTAQYGARVKGWEAHAVGGSLYIFVTGDINPDIKTKYM